MSTLKISRGGEALLSLLVNSGGGVTGLTAVVAVRDPSTAGSWLDFADGTFKTSGWTTRQAAMTEVSAANAPGVYERTLDLSAVSVPDTARLIAEYSFSGAFSGVAADVLELETLAELLDLYDHAVWIDTTGGTAGAVLGVNGTRANPVDNEADALTLASALGVRRFVLITGDLQLSGTYTDWIFEGLGGTVASGRYRFDASSPVLTGCTFRDTAAFGAIGTGSLTLLMERTWLVAVTNMPALTVLEACVFEGACGVNGAAAAFVMANGCQVQNAIGGAASFDLAGSSNLSVFTNLGGNLTILNGTDAGSGVRCHMVGGEITLDASCSAGEYQFGGAVRLVNNSTGTAVVTNDAWSPARAVEALLTATLSAHEAVSGSVAQALASLINGLRVNIATQKLEMLNAAHDTVIQSWDLDTTGGEPVATAAGVQTQRQGRDL